MQGDLFASAAGGLARSPNREQGGCLEGQHGPIVDGEPRDLGECVNVDWICSRCALILGEVSWSKEGPEPRPEAPKQPRNRRRAKAVVDLQEQAS